MVAADDGVGAAGQQQPGVVVEDVEDFHVGAIGEAPVGDVGLPEFVGLVGGQAFSGRAGSFVGLGYDESALVQDAPNRRYSRHIGDGGVAGQVFGDGGRAGVVALFAERLAQPHDGVFDLSADRVSVVVRAPRARLKRRDAVGVGSWTQ